MKDRFAVMVEGKHMPAKFHDSYEEAVIEAKRLTINERRNTFILKAIALLEVVDVKITNFK